MRNFVPIIKVPISGAEFGLSRKTLINLIFMKKALKTLNSLTSPSKMFATMVCLCAFMFGTVSAQSDVKSTEDGDGGEAKGGGKLVVGIRTGVNLSKLVIDGNSAASERRPGAVIGAFVTYNFNHWLAVSPEIMFSQTAAKRVDYNLSGFSSKADYRLNQVQMNLLFDARIPMVSVYKPRFVFGPSFDLNTRSTVEVNQDYNFEVNGAPLLIKKEFNASNEFKVLDFGMIVGAGLDFDLKRSVLKIDARYRAGISDINRQYYSGNETFRNGTIHSSNWVFTVAYGFKF